MLFNLLLLLPILGVNAELDHPVIDPPFPGGGLNSLEEGLTSHSTLPPYRVEDWGAGWIPEDVKRQAEGEGVPVTEIETFSVFYDDCETPWVMSRHKDADLTRDDLIHHFGIIPVRMRQYVRHLLALGGGGGAGSAGDNIVFNGPNGPTVFVHEAAHSIDGHAFPEEFGRPFSSGQMWLDAYNADSAVPDEYARTSQQENFANQMVVALFDETWPFELTRIQPSWPTIRNQYDLVKQQLGDKIRRNGLCGDRLENSKPVPMDGPAIVRRADLGAMPDVGIKGNVSVIKALESPETMLLTLYDKQGNVRGTKTVKLK